MDDVAIPVSDSQCDNVIEDFILYKVHYAVLADFISQNFMCMISPL